MHCNTYMIKLEDIEEMIDMPNNQKVDDRQAEEAEETDSIGLSELGAMPNKVL